MALNLKRLAKTAELNAAPEGTRVKKERPFDFTYGRGELPPAKGSDWGEFLDWASERSVITEADRQLAFNGWLGRLRWKQDVEDAPRHHSP